MLAVLMVALAIGQMPTAAPDVDLRKIGHIESKGRVQDTSHNQHDVVGRLLAAGPAAVPFLVSKLEDETTIPGGVFDFWPEVRVGDVAFVIICDLFLESDETTVTVPGLSWASLLEEHANPGLPSWELLHAFVAKHGRVAIRRKVESLLKTHGSELRWDSTERCLRPGKLPAAAAEQRAAPDRRADVVGAGG
jgi:hypothetical protein